MASPVTFEIHVEDSVLDDLRARLDRVRWPDEVPGGGWSYGTDLGFMRTLIDHWRDAYDWRAHEARLNEFSQFRVPLHDIDLHFIHEKGEGPAPFPLLLSHGWPGSVVEFEKLIPRLTHPSAFGGDAADAFTVVAPSLPGYGFSFTPDQRRFSISEIADVFAALMTDTLGYETFAAHGHDWGSFISSRLGYAYSERLVGIHITLIAVPREPAERVGITAEQARYNEQLAHWLREETGYSTIQGTRPQTLSYGLTDSPTGLAAWIVEKFRAWSDCGGDVESCFSRDTLLTNIMLYWVTGAINSSFWPYYARLHGPWIVPSGEKITVPTGYAEYPKEILSPPRSIAERLYGDIRRWTPMPRGGHFAAMEDPDGLAHEIREFFRPLRSRP